MTAPLRREVVIEAPRQVVFEMFTDPQLLTRWIGIAAWLDPQPDGRFRFEVSPGEFCSGRYVQVNRPHHVSFTWGWESDAIPEQFDLHEEGWDRFLARLAAVCEGRDPGSDPATERTPDQARDELRRRQEPT